MRRWSEQVVFCILEDSQDGSDKQEISISYEIGMQIGIENVRGLACSVNCERFDDNRDGESKY